MFCTEIALRNFDTFGVRKNRLFVSFEEFLFHADIVVGDGQHRDAICLRGCGTNYTRRC